MSQLELDPDDLARAFGRPVSSYDVEPIDPELRLHSVTGGVYRVRADGRTAVLKIVRFGTDADPNALWVSGAEPTHRNYWKREWLAFDSGLLDELPGRLRAPRTLLTTQPHDLEGWIWMEDAHGRHAGALTLDDYALIGRALGEMQGAFAVGTPPLPTDDWLSRKWLRGWVDASDAQVVALRDSPGWDDERLATLLPHRDRALELWAARGELLGIVEQAPHTLVHLDFWPMNLFVDDDDVVAIDWSQVGIGGVAQDLDQITLDPVWMQVMPDVDPRQLEWRIVPAYLEGLHSAGFDVDESDLQRWYAAAAAVKYLPLLELQVSVAVDPAKVAAAERRWSRPFADITASKARVVQRAIELGEWALSSPSGH